MTTSPLPHVHPTRSLPSRRLHAWNALALGALVGVLGACTPGKSQPSSEAGEPADAATTSACASKASSVHEALKSTVEQNPLDPLGYVPFAEDGCGLVYVSSSGRIVRIDFESGAREELEKGSRPSARDGVVAWEAVDETGRGVVRVRVGRGAPVTVPGTYKRAFEPRVGPDAVVFTFTNGDPGRDDADMDVALYTPSTGAVTVLAEGPGQQRFASVSRGHVAYTDFSEDPSGTFSLTEARNADVVVMDRATRVVTRRAAEGKQAFPLLDDDGFLLYTDFGAIHPEPKFQGGYAFKLGKVDAAVSLDRVVHAGSRVTSSIPWVQPSLAHGYVTWIEADRTLLRRSVSLGEAPREIGTSPTGFVGVLDGALAAFVATRASGPNEIFVEARGR
jgi:hypothetical protein